MRMLIHGLLVLAVLLAPGAVAVDPATTTPGAALPDFVPTEEVPADSALSFPVDI